MRVAQVESQADDEDAAGQDQVRLDAPQADPPGRGPVGPGVRRVQQGHELVVVLL